MSVTDKVNDYLANRMSSAETADFELQLLEDKVLQAELEQHMVLKRSLQAIEADAKAADANPSVPEAFKLAPPPVIYVETMRGAESSLQLDAMPVLLAIDVGPNSAEAFTVKITSADAQTVQLETTADETFADDEGYVNVLVPKLAPGQYQCHIASSSIRKTIQLTS